MSRQRPATARITQTSGFWELRAEQVMDRVFGGRQGSESTTQDATPFDQARRIASPAGIADRDTSDPPAEAQPAIDVVVQQPWAEDAEDPTLPDVFNAGLPAPAAPRAVRGRADVARDAQGRAAPQAAGAPTPSGPPTTTQLLLWGSLFSLPLLVLVGVLMRNLNHSETALNQERNLLLLERLRALSEPVPTAQAPGDRADRGAELPPPPPSDDWITELGQLPQSSAPRAEVLHVPASPRITAAAPAASPAAATAGPPSPNGPAPVLVGVIHSQGRGGSAIFQVGGASANAAIGELIGGSGWRLRATSGDSVLIVRGGEQRRLSISSAP